jgi:hypothetical protein
LKARGRFIQPEVGKEDLKELDRAASPLRTWAEDYCTFGNDEAMVFQDLYQKYMDAMWNGGRKALTRNPG